MEIMSFVITVRQIDNGFLTVIENKDEIVCTEKYCRDYAEIKKVVSTWITRLSCKKKQPCHREE